jgi:hypothetical protein
MEKSKEMIELIHSDAANPNHLVRYSARDAESLQKLSVEMLPLLRGKAKALSQLLGTETEKIQMSAKTRQFWAENKASVEVAMEVFLLVGKTDGEISGEKRSKLDGYFAEARKAWDGVKTVLHKVDKAMIGPYVLG